MNNLGFCSRVLLWSVCGFVSMSHAQDTDLFMTNNPNNDALPNVLIVLDNTANWSATSGAQTKFALEQAALSAVVEGLDENSYNVGLMLFSETGKGNANPSGGYVRSAIREMSSTNKAALGSLIAGLGENDDKGNGAEYALAMHEAYLYFKGLDLRSGDKKKTDADAFASKPRYAMPSTDACAKNYVIFISNGAPDNGENSTAKSLLGSVGGNTSQINLSPSGRQANWTDEYARYMNGQLIQTYTIDVGPLTTGVGPDNTALLKSTAQQGGGEYHAVYTADELVEILNDTFSKIQDVNSVFASTALPVSVNVRGTYLNEVYMGMFRPDPNAKPRWYGNLKLYQFAENTATGALYLADASSPPKIAQSTTTGFISSDAQSFWTRASSYWDFRDDPITASDSPDGDMVEKGGAAQIQRETYPARNLYTCTGSCASNDLLSDTSFATTNTSIAASLSTADAAEQDAIIQWIRGADNTSTAERNASEVRPSLHGDVVHSRPAVVNFNRTGTDSDIVVFYGANDGVFRAIKGGKTVSGGGSELWGFVAPEFFGKLKRMRDNAPDINVPSDPADTVDDKPYFADGNISVYIKDVNLDGQIQADDGDKAYLYITMRRGGRFIYALDVSVPEEPRMLWKKGCFGSTPTCDAGYGELGETWSEAKVATINLNGVATPVVIMGAGYDAAAEDVEPAVTRTQGRGIIVANALTGDVIWQAGPSPSGGAHNLTVAGMIGSVAADIAVIDRNSDGKADRLYAVDSKANVWRADISAADPTDWQVHLFASLGGTGVDARKFLFVPDVVYGEDANGAFDAVLVGAGDREHPFDTSVENSFFMLKDRNTGTSGGGTTITLSTLYDATSNAIQSTDTTIKSAAQAALLAASGWYISLADGEKLVGNALTSGGSVFFATNQPKPEDPNSCASNLGIARIYMMDYLNAAPVVDVDGVAGNDRFSEVKGGGFPPPPTAVTIQLDGEKKGTICFGPTCKEPPVEPLEARRKAYWYKDID